MGLCYSAIRRGRILSIRVEHLVKMYKRRRVVDDVHIEVEEGEVVGLLGPNGAGKTTTFYMVVGLVKPQKGQIFLHNKDITHLPMHKRAQRGIGYLAQEPSVFRKLTVAQNILAIWEIKKIPVRVQKQRLEILLGEFHIAHLAQSMGYQLSGGEQRRVEIARAMAADPDFLLLDEPFSGIDPIAVEDIQEMIAQLKDQGLGILITDHNVRETLAITDRAYILSNGKIVESGTPAQIAQSKVAREFYLGERFSLS